MPIISPPSVQMLHRKRPNYFKKKALPKSAFEPTGRDFKKIAAQFHKNFNPFEYFTKKVVKRTWLCIPRSDEQTRSSLPSQMTEVISTAQKIPEPKARANFLKKSFKKAFFTQSRKMDVNTTRGWLAYCLDLSILLNAISMIALFFTKKVSQLALSEAADEEEENGRGVAEPDPGAFRDELKLSLEEEPHLLESRLMEHDLKEEASSKESQETDRVISTLETILTDERNVLIGLQLTQLLGTVLLKKLKKHKK